MKAKIILTATLCYLMMGCASTPQGMMFMATAEAPDLATGAGCEKYGVWRQPGLTQVSAREFKPHFVQTWEIDKVCPSSGRQPVWGCYKEKTGDAYIVGRDWRVYWHEWCHAKIGGAHIRVSSGRTAP